MNDQKNTILAIVLSALVLIAWQYFYGMPQLEKQKQIQAEQAQQQAKPGAPGTPPAATTPTPQGAGAPPQAPGTAPTPGHVTAPASQASRPAALAASPRIQIQTPNLAGSVALKGGRIDDISLIKYRETVDPKSPAIVLLSPSGSPEPYYAEFGWIGDANTKVPTPETV
jgi:YidC/Oxa1 family membrane protein insertase